MAKTLLTDAELIRRAIDVTTLSGEEESLSARRFATDVLGVDERSVRYWLKGDRTMLGTVRIVCKAIVIRPSLADELVAAHEAVLKG